MPTVRRFQMGLLVSRSSYSSTWPGIFSTKSASMSQKRSVASAITPPGRMYEVCMR